MNDTRNITHSREVQESSATAELEGVKERKVRPNIEWPWRLWREIKRAALDEDKPPGKYVIEAMAQKMGVDLKSKAA